MGGMHLPDMSRHEEKFCISMTGELQKRMEAHLFGRLILHNAPAPGLACAHHNILSGTALQPWVARTSEHSQDFF